MLIKSRLFILILVPVDLLSVSRSLRRLASCIVRHRLIDSVTMDDASQHSGYFDRANMSDA